MIEFMPTKKKAQAKRAPTRTVPKKHRKASSVRQPASVKKPVTKRWHLAPQLTIAGSAITLLLLLGVIDRVTFATLPGKAAESMPATIGIEYEQPLQLSVLIARKEQAGYAAILNQSDETIHVSMPSSWSRTEVTGVPIAQVTSDIPVFGFTRWTLPAHSGLKMHLPQTPDSLFFDSTSAATAAINLQTVDLTNLKADSRVVLLQKQVLVTLWENERAGG